MAAGLKDWFLDVKNAYLSLSKLVGESTRLRKVRNISLLRQKVRASKKASKRVGAS